MTDKLKVIACGVFEHELDELSSRTDNTIDVELLDAGLHRAPDRLRLQLQDAVDRASEDGSYDAVAIAYGLCGKGVAGVEARDIPLIIPRAHDCIALFLGGQERYLQQFHGQPGTFYFTTGWWEKKCHPQDFSPRSTAESPEDHPKFEEYADRYGEDNARYIVRFLESWRENYRRAAFIDHGLAAEEHEEETRSIAEAMDWDYERIEGSLGLLRDLVDGNWDPERFQRVPPHHRLVLSGTNDLFEVVPCDAEASAERPVERPSHATVGARKTGRMPEGRLGLGIDAGGTFTDSVLFDFHEGSVVDKAKARTTHHELWRGIEASLSRLDISAFSAVDCACLSTTLATNAIVEGEGQPVGLLLMPCRGMSPDGIRAEHLRSLDARMDIRGRPLQPVHSDDVWRAAGELMDEGVKAFAVSGYASVKNPAHEKEVKRLLREEYGLPVVAGHELSENLNFVQRAHTAVLNARLLPLTAHLLDAVEDVLADRGADAPLFVVRGDGSLIGRDAARSRAVETVLSGPAASAAGAGYLSGESDCVVVDMGGTTTDVALLRDGRALRCPEGATVGGWRTCVEAADITTRGTGGDSWVRPSGAGQVSVGPQRVLPLSAAAEEHPDIKGPLEKMVDNPQAPSELEALEFFVLEGDADDERLDAEERKLARLLNRRPLSRTALARELDVAAPSLLRIDRLVERDIIRRCSVTPTDALHVLGDFTGLDAEAAEMGFTLLSRLLSTDAEETARTVRSRVERSLAREVAVRQLRAAGMEEPDDCENCAWLLDRMLGDEEGPDFDLRWEQQSAVVGIGAPVHAYLPRACRLLNTEASIPQHAEVANAVGAVTSRVLVREVASVKPGEFGSYIVHSRRGRTEHSTLEEAEEAAREAVIDITRQRARRFGTREDQVEVDVVPRYAHLRDGDPQLLEVRVEGQLAGAPSLRRPAVEK